MARIIPFKALRYDKRIKLDKAVCPPYDVINRQQRSEFLKKSAYNIVRIVLPERRAGNGGYVGAGNELSSWIDKGIFCQDSAESLYIYEQEFTLAGKLSKRLGFISLLGLESSKDKSPLPHENVFLKPLLDRVSLMKAVRAHLSPVFMVFDDKGGLCQARLKKIIKKIKPDLDIRADNCRHRLWRLNDKELVFGIQRKLDRSRTFIADGHHRFKASVMTRDYFDSRYRAPGGHRFTLAYFVSSRDKGLKILPTHRAVRQLPSGFGIDYIKDRLSPHFDVRQIKPSCADRLMKRAFLAKRCSFVMYYENKYIFISLKDKTIIKGMEPKGASLRWKGLDVSILHNLVLKRFLKIKERVKKERNIYYYKDSKELITHVNDGRYGLGILLNPSTMDDVIALAKNGERMPHKSTYFYPKPITGLVIHKF
ncbi:MAG: DUF1015 domain-containing protein [Candidatus Omnitrophica bacterium]|nr:DUF1015 domain-containing protein [Candidatus Omnitrophota bacterium]